MIDLNVCFEESLSKEAAFYLGKKYHLPLSIDFPKSLFINKENPSKDEFLEKRKMCLAFLQNPEGLELAGYSLVKDLNKLGYVYAEVRVTPLLHTEQGLTQRQIFNCVLRGIYKGLDEFDDIDIKVIFCLRRSSTLALNKHTIELALEYKNDVVVGIDLVGDENERSINAFKPLFDMAREGGLHVCAHPGTSEIGNAIAFGVERITLPCPILVSPELVTTVQGNRFIFEILPSYMRAINIIKEYKELPNVNLLQYGIPFIVSSKSLTILDTNIDNELKTLIKDAGYTYSDVREAINQAAMHCFASNQEKGELIKKLSSRFDYFYKDITFEND